MALAATLAAMYLLGFSLDNLSLMGLTIAVGFVIDDAIVMLENIYRHIEEGMKPMEAALKGASEIGFTIVSISFSLIAVFIPLLLMGGIVGRLFREFAMTVSCAVRRLRLRLADTDADDVLSLSCPATEAARPRLSDRGSRVRRHDRVLSANAGCRAALPLHHADGVPGHRHRDSALLFIAIPKGFFPTEDIGLIIAVTEGAAGRLVPAHGRSCRSR